MNEPERAGMQRLAGESCDGSADGWRECRHARLADTPIDRIADKRVADVGHMDPDLVRPPCFEAALDLSRIKPELTGEPVVGDGMLAPSVTEYRHPLSIAPVSPDIAFDPSLSGLRHAEDEGGIKALNRMIRELFGQSLVGAIAFGDDQQAAGIFVYPVNDARPLDATDTGEPVAAVCQQGIDERIFRIACARMNGQTGRFVDNNKVVVLKNDVEGHFYRLEVERFRRREGHLQPLALFDAVGGVGYRPPVRLNGPVFNQPLYAVAGKFGADGSKKAVDPLAGAFWRNEMFDRAVTIHVLHPIGRLI